MSKRAIDLAERLKTFNNDMTTEHLIVNIILRAGGEHFANAKAATGA